MADVLPITTNDGDGDDWPDSAYAAWATLLLDFVSDDDGQDEQAEGGGEC